MKVETATTRKPDVIITVLWEEAQVLRSVLGGIYGTSTHRSLTNDLYNKLGDLGVNEANINFGGKFND